MIDLSDKQGFYLVNGIKIKSKIDAFLLASQTNTTPEWNFNDEHFGQYDWSIEPEESIQELYRDRAIKLRNEYDYLVLHFSAGRDSGNVMETFIRNKIPVDEIFIRGPHDHLDKNNVRFDEKFFYAEIWLAAYPLAVQIKEKHYPNCKITVVDTKNQVIDFFKNNSDWFEKGNSNLNPGNYYKSDFDAINPEWQKMAEQGKKIGHIMGIDKPRIVNKGNKFYFAFLDPPVIDFCNPRCSDIDLPIYNELFYWHPDCAKMLIKQAHLVKNWIKKNANTSVICNNDWDSDNVDKIKDRRFEWHNQIANIIYDRSLPVLYECPKSLCEIRNGYLSWFWKDIQSEHYQNWQTGLDHLFSKIRPDLLDEEPSTQSNISIGNKPRLKLKGCWSKLYFIGR